MAKNKEKNIAVCRKHWSCFILPVFFVVICLLLAIVALLSLSDGGAGAVCIVLLVAAAVVLLNALIGYKTTYIALTETKIIGHIGFIRSRTLMTPLSKIQNVGLSNGLLGKILDYHTVTLSDAGGSLTEYVFKRMAHARDFADAVHGAIDRAA